MVREPLGETEAGGVAFGEYTGAGEFFGEAVGE